jgi:pyruvate dehydrogenase E1 component
MRGSTDPDTLETGEWIDSLRTVLHYRGPDRAAFLIEQLSDEA